MTQNLQNNILNIIELPSCEYVHNCFKNMKKCGKKVSSNFFGFNVNLSWSLRIFLKYTEYGYKT